MPGTGFIHSIILISSLHLPHLRIDVGSVTWGGNRDSLCQSPRHRFLGCEAGFVRKVRDVGWHLLGRSSALRLMSHWNGTRPC